MYTLFGIKFMKQKNMRQVLLATAPLVIAGVYFFGWRTLVLLLVNCLAAVFTEYLFKRKDGKPVTEAAFVSAMLYTLILPPAMSFIFSAIGMAFGIVFGKEVFGGFGRNVFNPAMVARAFVYISFAEQMTGRWNAPFTGFPGGFTQWLSAPMDTMATATPMLRYQNEGVLEPFQNLLLGTVSGTIGEVSAVLIIIGMIYLLVKKAAAYQNVLGMFIGFSLATLFFNLLGVEATQPYVQNLFSGGIIFAMAFMITDPITSARSSAGKYLTSGLAGVMTVVIRSFAIFPGGVMFAILIANMFGPIIDEGVKALGRKKVTRGES